MIEIDFNYRQQIIVIQANLNEIFKDIINKYLQKSLLDSNNIFFIANGKQLNPEEKIGEQINLIDKENKKVIILVEDIIEGSSIIQKLVKSKDIICPRCYEPCRIKTENFKISLFGCINNHKTILKIKDFFNSQNINISNINCEKCENRANSPKNEFYKCLTCNKNICSSCRSFHQSNHYIINYEQKNYICFNHQELFIKYCVQCNKNLCYLCEDEHEKHNQISFNEIKPNINERNCCLKLMDKEIKLFNNYIKEIIDKLNELIDTMNKYYEINNNIINNYNKKNRNYQILQNINQIKDNNEIYNILDNINKTSNAKDKLYKIIDLYNNINSEKEIKKEIIEESKKILNNNIINNINPNYKLNEMTIFYKIDKNEDEIKIFGSDFVNINENNCYLLIGDQQKKLCERYYLNKKEKNEIILKIKLIETNTITNMSNMFYYCTSLISLPDISEWDMINVTNMYSMFYNCCSLKLLPNISKWNTRNVTNMNYMFYNCCSLKSLPDISKWIINKKLKRNSMFISCNSKYIS